MAKTAEDAAEPQPSHKNSFKRESAVSISELESAIREFIAKHNQQPRPFLWTKTADQILNSIARFATSTLAAHQPETCKRNQ
jgi:hypothetical protein